MANHNPKNQFQKGVSGNPKGGPLKGYSITETVKAMLNQKPEIKQALTDKLFQHAMAGDMAAIKLLWSYMDGLPAMKIDAKSELTHIIVTRQEGENKIIEGEIVRPEEE